MPGLITQLCEESLTLLLYLGGRFLSLEIEKTCLIVQISMPSSCLARSVEQFLNELVMENSFFLLKQKVLSSA